MKFALLTISTIVTAICWYFIIRSQDPWYIKIITAIVVAIPFFGPFFYALVLHKTPSIKPIEEQAKMSHYLNVSDRRNYDPVQQEDVDPNKK
jgi:hypothetical protein